MSRRLSYSKEAERDLREITAHTLRTWGHDQAGKYMRGLRNDIAALRTSAMQHPRHDDLIPGMRRRRSGHHSIFYLTNDDRILVVRVLHERADYDALIG